MINNLFATYAQDKLDWSQEKQDQAPFSYSSINSDLRNLKTLQENEPDTINSINTCLVDLLGKRVIVQTVLQGILHFDQNNWNLYGTTDDGKTLSWN